MPPGPFDDRVARLLRASPDLAAYERWRAARPRDRAGPRDYLFLDERPRFEPRRGDVVTALPGLAARRRDGAVHLVAASPPADVEVPGVDLPAAERFLAALDGERCLVEAAWAAGIDAATTARLLRAGFGRVLFAPEAVTALEARLSGVEVVRWPSVPYAVDRSYWENMADVRARFLAHAGEIGRPDAFVRRVRELHVVLLLGESLESYYEPASPAAGEAVDPGALWDAAPRVRETPRGTVFLDGPRVGATLVGGEPYWRRLARDLGDERAAAAERAHADGTVEWGRVVTARGEGDDGPRAWFLPPRPIRDGHVEALRSALAEAIDAAGAGDADRATRAAAIFHQRFVRLHPFRCANQSLAMNLANAALSRAVGAGIPHLLLDHLALRLAPHAYAEAFRRAVAGWAVGDPDPARRLRASMDRRRRAIALMDRLAACAADADADRAIAADEQAAGWLLLGHR